MAKLRHLALWTRQPEKMAEFYTRVFEMKEMFRTKNGSIHLSDGWSGSTLPKDKGGPNV